ncbi:hypothetical protein NDA16_001381 [Ustilago loliicola]|nr:hypothetical protein NDA16_001381 [Ustilago loliicola]
MVSTRNVSENGGRASTSQREPPRGQEAIANSFGRLSTDQGSLRAKNAESSLSSFAGSMRRSSSGTEFYSQAHSANGADEATTIDAAPAKAPRVYTSFSAAKAAASRSSLNKRGSRASFSSNAAPSPSMHNSPSFSSPHTTSSAFGDAAQSSSGGGGVSGFTSSSAANKGTSFDISSANQYTPGSLASTFPWLSTNPASPSRRSETYERATPSAHSRLNVQSKLDSPPVSLYSKGKGYGYNPNEDHRAPRSGSKIRLTSNASKADMRESRDSIGRGHGLKSSSELDLPERMRGQRKGAPAPPRLSQDPIAISIEEELKPNTNMPRNESAFSRLGRAFRRKSKSGTEFKADLGTSRDLPPLPKTPRRVPSQALKPTDPFAEKALRASSGIVDVASLRSRDSVDVKGKQRQVSDASTDMQSPRGSDAIVPIVRTTNTFAQSIDEQSLGQQQVKARVATPEQPDANGGAGRAQGATTGEEHALSLVSSNTAAAGGKTEEIATAGIHANGKEASPAQNSRQIQADDRYAEDEEVREVESATQIKPADFDAAPHTADSDNAQVRSNTAEPPTGSAIASSKRPTSMESTTSSAGRRSLAFLASAISMGAIAVETEEEDGQVEVNDNKLKEADGHDKATHDATSADDPIETAWPSLTSIPITVSRTNSTSSMPKDAAQIDQTAPNFTSMSRTQSSDRRRLEPKLATRNDQIPSILTDFLSMDADTSAREGKKGKTKASSNRAVDNSAAADLSNDASSTTLERSISGTSDSRKSSYSTSPKASRATKGVYMAPAAGPSMGGFVSPFYVPPLTSVDAGLANRATRPTGRRASNSSRSVHSDDSRSNHSGPRRGSRSLAVPENAPREGQDGAGARKPDESHADQSRESATSEKARKVKSFGNLRASSNDQREEPMPRASTSRLLSPSVLADDAVTHRSRGPNEAASTSNADAATSNNISDTSRDSGLSMSNSASQRSLRRPKTSGTEAGLGSERSGLSSSQAGGLASSRRGSVPGRTSLDESGRSSKPFSSSPTEGGFEMLASRDVASTPVRQRDAGEQRDNSVAENARDKMFGSRLSSSDRRDSSGLGRRPSGTSNGAITPSSSRIESHGGAASLFGNPTTRPRTSSLLPSFGFNRSRTGSSAGLEGSGKSPGSFGNASRSASGGFWRDSGDPLTPAARSGATEADAQQQDLNGANRSPRASSSSRPSFSRQLSASTALSDAESKQVSDKPKKKFSLSAFLPYDDEDAPEYAERIASTAPKTQIAAILASSPDTFYVDALHHFMTRFWFNGLPLDIALRKLLMDLHLPKETQQIDRVMEAFAKRYNECNSGLFASDDQPYILSFSLMMLHTDAFNKNAKNKMTKADYLRNTGSSGVPTDILEYLYDNLTFTQFIYIEDEEAGRRRPSEASSMSMVGPAMSGSLATQGANANNRTKLDPYYLITQGRLGELRPDLEHLIPEDTPFSYTGSLPSFDVNRLNSAFLHAPSIEIVTTKNSGEQPGAGHPAPVTGEEEVVSLKVTKVGVVNRKDDVSDGGKKSASRKWKTSGLLLTGSQLLLFKDIIWINALQSQILDQVGDSLLCNGIPTDEQANHEVVEGGVVISPRITYFRPDGVISLADAVAVKDHSYGKYDFVFRLLAAKGRQYLVQAQSEDDMNDWIHKINFCASFRTANIKIRGLDLAPRIGSGAATQDLNSLDRSDTLESRFGRPALSRPSFSDSDRASRGMDADGSGRSTPVPDDTGDLSRDGALRLSVDPMSRNSESDGPPRPRSSASHRMSPASSALQKRAKARRELMLTKIAETEVQLERASARLAEEIRLARHFAILTPFLKSTRERIEMSALPLSSRIRTLRLDVAKAESRCKILRLDLAAGERVTRALLPNAYLSSSAMRAANRTPSAQVGTPQLLELGSITDSQAQFEELFASINNGSGTYDAPSNTAALSGTVTKPASHQRNQMNLNAVSEQPADESPVMSSRLELAGEPRSQHAQETVAKRPSSPSQSIASRSSAEHQDRDQSEERGSAADEVPEDWDLSQVARASTNRISLVDLPSPDELQEATGGRFRFGVRTAE